MNEKQELDDKLSLVNMDDIAKENKQTVTRWESLQDKYSFLCKWYWRDLWYRIDCWVCPRNKWARNAVGNSWLDLDSVYVNILFAGIISYVEEQDALNFIDWKHHKDTIAAERKIKEIYKWAKTGRATLQKRIDAAYPQTTVNKTGIGDMLQRSPEDAKKTYDELYGEVNRLEKLLYDTDSMHLTWLIRHRNILWT